MSGQAASAPIIDKVAWLHVREGRVLSTRSRGKDTYYLPGGKREPGESDEDCVCREIEEELAVRLRRDSLRKVGFFEAQAHGNPEGVKIHMSCYDADYEGTLAASAEIEEFVWLSYADRDRVAPVDQIIFDWLRDRGQLR
jgi:8-oxo-dGTP diphosphatase